MLLYSLPKHAGGDYLPVATLYESKVFTFLYFYCHHPEYLKKVISHYLILKGNARCISKVISTSVEVIKSMIYIRNIYLSKRLSKEIKQLLKEILSKLNSVVILQKNETN